jgi:hypothetical protein
MGIRLFRLFVTPAQAGVHREAGAVAGFESAARLTGFPHARE